LTCLPGILFLILFLVIGVLCIVGAYRRWRWLVDPEGTSLWVQAWSQYWLKQMIGRRGLLVYTYVTGSLFVLIAVFALAFIPCP
jgi:Immunity protein 17